jgi:hypothetical protein
MASPENAIAMLTASGRPSGTDTMIRAIEVVKALIIF